MKNVYEQVDGNKRKSIVIITLFTAFILFSTYAISYAFNISGLFPLAVLFSIGSSFASFYWGDRIVLSLNQAIPADRKKYFDFYTTTENLCLVAQIPKPKIFVIESDAMNAFATGRDPEHAVICATTGLLEKLNRTELEAVVGHELSHVKNYDIRLMMIVSILIGTLSILINMSWYMGRNRDSESKDNNILAIIGIVLIIFAPIIGQLIQLAISRRREFLADASSVMLTRQPSGLIGALKKISGDPNILDTASTATASLYISNPFKGNKIASLFSTHPPIADRIKVLEEMM
jgi:heat shock protein HtpX